MVRGYHACQSVWEAVVRKELACQRERANSEDHFAVAVMKRETIIGHVPRRIFAGANFGRDKFSRVAVRSRKSQKFLSRENFPLHGTLQKLTATCMSYLQLHLSVIEVPYMSLQMKATSLFIHFR